MKNIFICFSVFLLMGLTSCYSQNQGSRALNKEQRALQKEVATAQRKAQVVDLLTSGSYKIVIQRAFSVYLSKPFNDITGYYFLKVTPDMIESFMPYFGKVYNQPQRGRMSPLDFSSTDFKVDVLQSITGDNGVQETKISITSSTNSMAYEYFIKVLDNGNATINVTSASVQSMQFMGSVQPL